MVHCDYKSSPVRANSIGGNFTNISLSGLRRRLPAIFEEKNESLEQQMCATIKIWFLAELHCRELVAWFIAPQKVRLSGAKTEINNHGKPPRARSHMCALYNGRQTSRSSGTLRRHSTACRESSRGQGRTQGRGFGLLWTNDPVAANLVHWGFQLKQLLPKSVKLFQIFVLYRRLL